MLKIDLPTQKSHFLIALSGGLDSTALLSLLVKQREIQPHLNLRAIHIHHGLSPNADNWVAHCIQLCRQLHVPLIIEKVQVDRTQGVEAGAREARYNAIAKHLQPNELLVTAHHQQDQTETFFLALKRGSGLRGLSAMQTQSCIYNLPLFRPLLSFTRTELEDYVKKQALNWVEDESNLDNRYERNFLRNQILPALRQRWGHFDLAVQRSAQHCFEQQQLINELLAETFQQHYDKNHRTLNIHSFPQYSALKQKALLRLWLEQLHQPMPSTVQLNQLIQDVIFAQQDKNPQFLFNKQVIRRYQHRLYLTDCFADISHIQFEVKPNQIIELPDNLGMLSLKKHFTELEIQWKQHNIRLPLATAHSIQIRFRYSDKVRDKNGINQDIKKVWQAYQVPPWLRQRIPLIFYGEEFQCAVGYFVNQLANIQNR